MSAPLTSPASTHTPSSPTGSSPTPGRQIGPIGTWARAVLGTALLVGAGMAGIGVIDVVIGLGAANLAVVAVMCLRGFDAPPLRFTGIWGHVVNLGVGVPFVALLPVSGMLFYGSAMLLAAARGFGACEMLAGWNLLTRRDDMIGCPVFSPLDHVEQARAGHAADHC